MSHIITTPLIEYAGQQWQIDTRKSGVYSNIIHATLGQLFAMLSHHNKVLVFRFDLHCPEHTSTNKNITDFVRRLSRQVMRRYGLTRLGYCWVREQEKAKQQHYHFALMLDGNKIQKPSLIWEMAKKHWGFMGGADWLPKDAYYRLTCKSYTETQEAIMRLSYLAKGRGKGCRPAQTKSYGTSRIAHASNKTPHKAP